MAKINIGRTFTIFPMPVVIVGSVVDDKPNFMAAAWVTYVNYDPPMVAVSLGQRQHTAKGIRQNGQFGLSVPSADQAVLTDYLGLVHGYEEDKTRHLEVFYGALEKAPMVRQCPASMECQLFQTVEMPGGYLFIGQVMATYASEAVLTEGDLDFAKLQPFLLTMPGNAYWKLGERVGEAWSIGKALLAKQV